MSYTDDKTALISVTMSFFILVMMDLVGNTLVILVILTNKSMQTPMNYLLVNLAVADIMVATFVIPIFLINPFIIQPEGLTGELICKFLSAGSFVWVGSTASAFTLVTISYERYFATVHPYSRGKRITMQKMKRLVVACWIFSAFFNISAFLSTTLQTEHRFCIEEWPKDPAWLAQGYSVLWLIVMGVIPVTIMFVLYSRVIHTLWFKHTRAVLPRGQLAVQKSRKKVTKVVVTVSIIYGLCWMSDCIVYMMQRFGVKYYYGDASWIGVVLVVTLNSTINPFIYTFQSQKFRSYLKMLICCEKLFKNRVATAKQESSTHKTIQSRLETGRDTITAEHSV